eukprot:3677990-Pleurochrysis_carterae.AAC.1
MAYYSVLEHIVLMRLDQGVCHRQLQHRRGAFATRKHRFGNAYQVVHHASYILGKTEMRWTHG